MIWETVIGVEVHVELATKSKIFCSCTTQFGGAPNTHCCPVCTGMPGTLPVLNAAVLEFALMAGIALGCKIPKENRFDRKNYFYPDLPKAYQISQLYLPFAQNGSVETPVSPEKMKSIGIHEIHMEEDAGKLIHSEAGNETYPDYNRCGVPLIEIVSEPDFRSAGEVITFLEMLKSTLEYLGVSDCKMQEGSMRADVNISVKRASDNVLGTRTELKNLNSFKAIERAIEAESARQISVLEQSGEVEQQTRRWDDNLRQSSVLRGKENAQDYRYFPEPDIPPITVSDDVIKRIKESLPELAHAKKKRYINDMHLSEKDAANLSSNKHLAALFEETASLTKNPKETANWILVQLLKLQNDRGTAYDSIPVSPRQFAGIISTVLSGEISRKSGTGLLTLVYNQPELNIKEYIKQHNLSVVSDDGIITAAAQKVIEAFPDSVQQYREGKTKVLSFFVGQAMKELKGKADPSAVNRIVECELQKK